MNILRFFTYNWKIKLAAILVAVGMWTYAASIETNVAKFPSDIPIGVINLTPGYTAIFEQKDVSIEIAAESSVWQKLSASSFTAFIDLNGFSVGTYEVPVNVTTQIADLSIVSKNPNQIVVTIEPAVEKEVPIVAKVEGDAAENMIAGDVVFDPPTAKISGPESVVSGIGQATAEIILSGESQDFTKAVKLAALDNKSEPIKNISFSPQQVVANVKIVKAGNVKNVGVKVATDGVPASGFFISSVSTDPAIVSISGVPNIIRSLSSIDTEAVDISGLNSTTTKTVALKVPSGVLIEGDKNSVVVTLVISPISITKPLTIPVSIINLPPTLSLESVTPSSVDIVVSGQSGIIQDLQASSITLNINLASAHSGENTYVINSSDFSLPSGVSVASISNQSLVVKLSQ